MRPLIELSGISKVYSSGGNEVHALAGVSLCVYAGEFVAIVGSSGSGKSTLMNMLGCLDIPTNGVYRLDGQEVSGLSDNALSDIRNLRIGFVFQGFNLIPSLNAVENVELPLIYRGMPREKRRRLAHEALDRVGLSGRVSHRPAQMSGGQQQRVAIARAIAAQPPIILADEPTGNLDSASGADVLAVLKSLWERGRTVILITHDEQVAREAGRVIRMQDGMVVTDKIARKEDSTLRRA
ncbi:MAG: ABC transporter ATP-binding protein [Oscillospiraceae bacterium]|nr:ABC transporter ATP-binding protein [Oscillospiraceae bacterium]